MVLPEYGVSLRSYFILLPIFEDSSSLWAMSDIDDSDFSRSDKLKRSSDEIIWNSDGLLYFSYICCH